jgi:hypothetical protein
MAPQTIHDQIVATLRDVKDITDSSRRMDITEEQLGKARDMLKNAVMFMKEAGYRGGDVPGIETMGPSQLNYAADQKLNDMNSGMPRPPVGGRRRKTRKPRKPRKGRKGIFTRKAKRT